MHFVIHPAFASEIAARDAVKAQTYAGFANGGIPLGANTLIAVPIGAVSYQDVAGRLAKAPSNAVSREATFSAVRNGLFVETLASKIQSFAVNEEMTVNSRVPAYRRASLAAQLAQARTDIGRVGNMPFSIVRVVDGVATLFTRNRLLGRVFPASGERAIDVVPVATMRSIVNNGLGPDVPDQAIELALSGMHGFVATPQTVDASTVDWIRSMAPGIACQPWWVIASLGMHMDEIDAAGVISLHAQLVERIKGAPELNSTRDLANFMVDALQTMVPSASVEVVNFALDWTAGRYRWVGPEGVTQLLQGLPPTMVQSVYQDAVRSGVNFTINGETATVPGMELLGDSSDVWSALSAVFGELDRILVALLVLLMKDGEGQVSPVALEQSGITFIVNRMWWSIR